MSITCRIPALALGLALAIVCSAAPARRGHAAPSARARGYKAYRAGKYREAIEHFKRAHRRELKAGLLYNIAKSYEKLGEYKNAIDFLRKYLAAAPGASDRKDVEATIADLSRRMTAAKPEVEIASTPSGARVHVDGNFAGETPLVLRLQPGNRRIRFALERYESKERLLQVRAGPKQRVSVLLERADRAGKLKVISEITGARVRIDGELRGLTPVNEPISVKGGVHQLSIEKDGYVAYKQLVQIQKGKTKLVYAKLSAIDTSTSNKTIFGWLTLSVAVLCEGAAWVFYWRGTKFYEGTSDHSLFRTLTGSMHISAGVLAATGITLLIWRAAEGGVEKAKSSAGLKIGPGSVRVTW